MTALFLCAIRIVVAFDVKYGKNEGGSVGTTDTIQVSQEETGMKLKKLISAACSAAMLTALVPAPIVSDAAVTPPLDIYISDIKLMGATGIYMNILRAYKLKHDEERSTYYQCFDTGVSWSTAVKLCSDMSGHLADCSDEHESYELQYATMEAERNLYWLGGRLNADDDLIWYGDEQSDYSFWAVGQPDREEFGEYVLIHRKRMDKKPPMSIGSADELAYNYNIRNVGFICEWDKDEIMDAPPAFADAHVEIIPVLTTPAETTETASPATTTTTTASSTKVSTASATSSKTTTARTTTSKTASSTSKAAKTTTTSKTAASKYGDANCDKKVTVADAVAILQSIANKDKYELQPQGKINADCYNPGDGVTANDALAIQKLDAGEIKSLPLKSVG